MDNDQDSEKYEIEHQGWNEVGVIIYQRDWYQPYVFLTGYATGHTLDNEYQSHSAPVFLLDNISPAECWWR